MKQYLLFKKTKPLNALGKLPLHLYSQREHFLLKIWEEFRIRGVHGNKNQGNENPFITPEALAEFILQEYPEVQSASIQKFDARPDRLQIVFTSGSSVSFVPTLLAPVIFKIAGEEALKSLSNEVFSPTNPRLLRCLAPFLIKDDYISQSHGINFSDEGIFAASNIGLIWIHHTSSIRGFFSKKGTPIAKPNPLVNYLKAIPQEISQVIHAPVDELLTIAQRLINPQIKEEVKNPALILNAGPDGLRINYSRRQAMQDSILVRSYTQAQRVQIAFSAELLISVLKMLKTQKVKHIDFEINPTSTLVIIKTQLEDFGMSTLLLGPMKIEAPIQETKNPKQNPLVLKYKYRLMLQKQQLINTQS